MDSAGRLHPLPSSHRISPVMSVIDLSGAPPPYEQPSTSRTSPPRHSSSSPADYYYSSSRTGHIKTIVANQHHPHAGCRSAPDYSVSTNGEFLSEKAPRGQATHHQISPSSSHSTCIRSPNGAISPPRYPPTMSRDDGGGCFASLPPKVKLWLSFGAWIATSVGFIVAVAFYKTEVFTGLDNLSGWLLQEGYTGQAYMFGLIVLTTIPPFPLYSTLMMLAGYTWGTWTGFVISYTSSLFGAIVVYFISRHFFGPSLISLLRHMPSFARTVRAVARNPKLLFLIRLAPYPYNVMNVLLAACPSLKWKTYIGCTAFSLLKVVIHTSIGSGIRSFKSFHGVGEDDGTLEDGERTASEQQSHDLAKYSTIVGVVLCVLLFVYLSHVARRAVDSELEDEEGFECPNNNGSLLPTHYRQLEDVRSPAYSANRHQREPSTAEERMAFLSPVGNDSDEEEDGAAAAEMSESRITGTIVGSRRR